MRCNMIIDKDRRFFVHIPITLVFSLFAAIITYLIYGFTVFWFTRTIACILLFLLTQSDIKYRKIPKPYTNVLLLAGIVDMFGGGVPVWQRLLWFVICMLPMYMLVYFNPKTIGGGDMRVISFMALFLGRGVLWMLLVTIGLVSLYIIGKKLVGLQKKQFVPMGGFLAVAVYIVFLFDLL